MSLLGLAMTTRDDDERAASAMWASSTGASGASGDGAGSGASGGAGASAAGVGSSQVVSFVARFHQYGAPLCASTCLSQVAAGAGAASEASSASELASESLP